jgi:hypothetical protein
VPAFDMCLATTSGAGANRRGKDILRNNKLPGIAERKAGVFTEHLFFVKERKEYTADTDSNVYTLFRFILEDFG